MPLLSSSMSRCLALFLGLAFFAQTGLAVKPSDQLLPDTTKGYFSTPDVDVMRAAWDKTQFGALMKHPAMKPFAKDFRRQMSEKIAQTGVRLGIKLEDMDGIYGGELAVARIQPSGDPKQHAMVMIVDVTDHIPAAEELLAKVERDLKAQRGRRGEFKVGKATVITYKVPRKKEEMRELEVFYTIVDDMLIAADHEDMAREVIGRLIGVLDAKKTLSTVAAYATAMKKTVKADGEVDPHVRWFIEPFGYAEVSRAASEDKKDAKGKDMLKILSNQGFRAIQGFGGHVTFAAETQDILHRSFVYAPPVVGADGDERYELAARMLRFPNLDEAETETLAIQPWVPNKTATYITFNWEMQKAFTYSESLIDEYAGAEGTFQEVMKALKLDPDGPQIDIPNELVAHLAERATLYTDYELPITPTSERWLATIAIKPGKLANVKRTIDKAMTHDEAEGIPVGDHIIWEFTGEEEEELEAPMIDGGIGFAPLGVPEEEEPDEEDAEPMISNAAVCVANGHLLVASHTATIKKVLVGAKANLADAEDYHRIDRALAELGAGNDSMRVFSRTDDAYRPTYELIRQGKMPQSEMILGKMLNNMFATEDAEEGELREQTIDGKEMPEFEIVKEFFGPAGLYVRTVEDGWMATGCMLEKGPSIAVAKQPEDTKKPEKPKKDDSAE